MNNTVLLSLATLSLVSLSTLSTVAAKQYTQAQCPVVGNTSTHVYYTSASANYGNLLIQNAGVDYRQCFPTVATAEKAGFHKTLAGAVVDKTEQQVEKTVANTKRVVKADAKKMSNATKKAQKKIVKTSVAVKETVVKNTKKVDATVKKTTKKGLNNTSNTVDKLNDRLTVSRKKSAT